ncbi:MAG: ISNCY family transposase [Candidatus Levybacteria bacterium CG_4_10_14_0_8_um_filter_35_23]|nr:MAG: ISNCY family transposase [Candidatus Levybacteria bacterium CG_4_10_14_0_8_um_filter_35_23]
MTRKGVVKKMKGIISMNVKETERIAIMDNLIAKRIKQKHASCQLRISVRQIQRLVKRYKWEGVSGLIHKSRGRIGNRAMPEEKKDQIVLLIKQQYSDFGPTLAAEKLAERHGINVSEEKVRLLMIREELWKARQRKQIIIHTYRERRSCVGELIQLDGSPHKWFEDRADSCTLAAFIDDATSRIMDGEFVDYEGTFTLFNATEHYLKTYGKPLSFYVDKHSTFKINRQATIEEELKDFLPQSQFARAMDNLRIELIFANSPQAKGRVERLFETLQDRLVKEMRLEGISTKEEGTKYFRDIYIPKHNARFAVLPKDQTNAHRVLLPSNDLLRIFTVQTVRHVSKALVIQYRNTRYQLDTTKPYQYLLKNQQILVEENKQGVLVFRYKDKAIPYKIIGQIIKQPKFMQVASAKSFQERQVLIRIKDPWSEPMQLPAL